MFVCLCARSRVAIVHPVPNWGVCESRSRRRAPACVRMSACMHTCMSIFRVACHRGLPCMHGARLFVLASLGVWCCFGYGRGAFLPVNSLFVPCCIDTSKEKDCASLPVRCNSKLNLNPLAASASAAGTAPHLCCMVHGTTVGL